MARKKITVIVAALLSFIMAAGVLSACGGKKTFKMTLAGGGDLPASISVELGDLCSVPEVEASKGETFFTVVSKVTDSAGAAVTVTNGKFRANSTGGYTITYTADDENATVKTIAVTVTKTSLPRISVNMPEGMVILKDVPFEIPACKITDASSSTLEAVITVSHETAGAVTVAGNKFTPLEFGEYTIRYAATDTFGNTGTHDLVVTCLKADMLNDFTTEDSIGWMPAPLTKELQNVDTETGKGRGMKILAPSDGNAWSRICTPLWLNGNYISWNNLKKYEKLQINVYAAEDNEFGIAMKVWPVKQGKNILVIPMTEVIASRNAAPEQYSADGNGFYLNLRNVTAGMYVILEDFIGIFADDYVEEPDPLELTLTTGGAIPESVTVFLGDPYTPPAVKAFRGDTVLTPSMVIKDKNGDTVELTEGKLDVTDPNGYVITYSVTDGGETVTKTLNVNIDLSEEVRFLINGCDGMTAIYNKDFTVPACTVKDVLGAELTYSVAVKDDSGADVTVTSGKFLADDLGGTYTITYTITSEGYTGSEAITVKCLDAVLLNNFSTVAQDAASVCLAYTSFQRTLELVTENVVSENGVKMTVTNATTVNWARICIPLRVNGAFITWEELQAFDKVQVYVWASEAGALGLCHSGFPMQAGMNILEYSKADILAGFTADPAQYSANENGFYLNLQAATPGLVLIFDSFMGIKTA